MFIYLGVGEANLPQIPHDVAPEKWQMIQLEDVLLPESFSNGTPFQWQQVKRWGCRYIYLLRALENSIYVQHHYVDGFPSFIGCLFQSSPFNHTLLPTQKHLPWTPKPWKMKVLNYIYGL